MQPMPPDVHAAFEAFPPEVRNRLIEVRAMISGIAGEDLRIGEITETLKWGEPAYLTEATRSGSTIRLGWSKPGPSRAAVYFNCSTTLVADFRERFGDMFEYEGNRAVLLPVAGEMPHAPVAVMLAMALSYHRTKKTRPLRAAPI